MPEIHTIAVANGGGDAPGINAVVRGVVKRVDPGGELVRVARSVGITFGDEA